MDSLAVESPTSFCSVFRSPLQHQEVLLCRRLPLRSSCHPSRVYGYSGPICVPLSLTVYTKEHERKKASLAKEQVIEESQKERETKRIERRAAEEIEQLAREQARREAYLAQEKAIAEAQEAKKLKAKKQPPE